MMYCHNCTSSRSWYPQDMLVWMKTWSRPQHLDTVILGCDWSERGDTALPLVRRGPGPGSVLATATETSVTSFSMMGPGDQQTCKRCLTKHRLFTFKLRSHTACVYNPKEEAL